MIEIYTLVEDYAGYETSFWGQHGISFLIEYKNKRVMFDTGQSEDPIIHNAKLLNLDLKNIDYIFLSHCHYDHTGGVLGVLKEIGKKTSVVAHPTIFREHFVKEPYLRYVGIPFSRKEIEEFGILLLVDEPFQLAKDIYSTGEIIEREEFEKTVLETYSIKDGKFIKDELLDDMSLIIKSPDGLIIISGCSHAGIVSIIKHAIKITGERKIRAVIGGFHLIDASEERIEKTINSFKELDVEEVYAGHCTGLRAEAKFQETYRKKFHKLHAGMKIVI